MLDLHPPGGYTLGFCMSNISGMTGTAPYPNAPLALAIVEVRHPTAGPLDSQALGSAKAILAEFTPLQRVEQRAEVDLASGSQRTVVLPKLIARDKQTSVAFGAESIIVETTAYKGWQAFRALLAASLNARQVVSPVEGFERIGLRYIDEIRVPGAGDVVNWPDWVGVGLLGPWRTFEGLRLSQTQQQGVSIYATDRPGETYTLRYGAMEGPPVVGTAPNLVRRDMPNPGHFFLLDTDGAWELGRDAGIPEFDPTEILSIADRIHLPIKEIFELSITERLRKEVLEIGK